MTPSVTCPSCKSEKAIEEVLTAQSNQNVIYICSDCGFTRKNITTKKG
jgi:uncharacterized Zn finger protein